MITGWEEVAFLCGETVALIVGADGLAFIALLAEVLPKAIVCCILRLLFSIAVLSPLAAGWFEVALPYLLLIGVLMSFFIASSSLVSSPRFS